jgi:hypothetical protein
MLKNKFSFWTKLSLLVLILTHYTNTQSDTPTSAYCIEGCLKCNLVTGFCDICDLSQGFLSTVDSKGCQKSADEFCLVLSKPPFPFNKQI